MPTHRCHPASGWIRPLQWNWSCQSIRSLQIRRCGILADAGSSWSTVHAPLAGILCKSCTPTGWWRGEHYDSVVDPPIYGSFRFLFLLHLLNILYSQELGFQHAESNVLISIPFSSLSLLSLSRNLHQELDSWKTLDLKLHAYLASNGVASRASSSQGAGLIRVGRHWLSSTWPKKGHYATAFGLLAARHWRGKCTKCTGMLVLLVFKVKEILFSWCVRGELKIRMSLIFLWNLEIMFPLWISTLILLWWSFTAIHDFSLCKWQFFCSTTSPNHLLAIGTRVAALADRTSMTCTHILTHIYIYINILYHIYFIHTHTYEHSC